MKVTNISQKTIFLRDLRFVAQAQSEGRRGEDVYVHPAGTVDKNGNPIPNYVYLPNTSQVLRSAMAGDLRKWRDIGVITLEDVVDLDANGGPNDSITLAHPFGFPPAVSVLKQVTFGPTTTWVDATGTYDLVHNIDNTQGPSATPPGYVVPTIFESVTITNTTAFPLTFMIRFL